MEKQNRNEPIPIRLHIGKREQAAYDPVGIWLQESECCPGEIRLMAINRNGEEKTICRLKPSQSENGELVGIEVRAPSGCEMERVYDDHGGFRHPSCFVALD